ncbi:ExeA family protein [Oceanisphaera sp. KMM 10153]|uniref:ExeA family protein n=1 Tax=Oceanisphaera submarina TaxID=3390193 RepID=UPI003975BFD6
MYDSYFGLSDLPFSIAPDPRYLYLSQQHREALAHLQYGLSCNGGFVLLTGEVGTGKTTVCRSLLEQVPEHTDLAFILNPKYTAQELLSAICQELAIPLNEGANLKQLTDAIHHRLLNAHAQGRQTVLMIDEAQNLSTEVLEQIRLLTNLETNTHKLLQIILLGQPELADKLKQPELRQLSQRITARYHLAPLSFSEMKAYIAHRLSVAGIEAALFRHNSLRRLYRLTGGVPRLINVICDRALLGAYVQRLPRVDLATLNRAAVEVLGVSPTLARWRPLVIAAGLLALMVTGGWLAQSTWPGITGISGLATPTPVVSHNDRSQRQEEKGTTGIQTPELAPTDQSASTPTPNDAVTRFDPWQWPAALTTDLSQVMAYQHLFALWGLDYDPTEDPVVCPFARRHRLECAFQSGDLDTVRQQNHPVIFRLEHPEKGAVYATLIRFNDERADLMVGGQLKSMSLMKLAASWPHSYVLLWQLPPHYQAPLYPGSKGKVVAWLEQQMAHWQERAPRRQHQHYDEVLVGNIRAFQRSRGLTADGIFGPQTSIYLNAMLMNDAPRLSGQQEITSVIYP